MMRYEKYELIIGASSNCCPAIIFSNFFTIKDFVFNLSLVSTKLFIYPL